MQDERQVNNYQIVKEIFLKINLNSNRFRKRWFYVQYLEAYTKKVRNKNEFFSRTINGISKDPLKINLSIGFLFKI